ncbi:alpha/beta hydrolase [Micromonospora sp. WMMD882]|uniref:alpha/beta fold hydrolase n=1 Tax=Micromonospora sp. WMMD882 TaxID=3015151 RepID=UPI00248C42FA|nr:alpha/beta hydrolase [Micromonospora sp. WMMD882]WBB78696.1 alpha/beta hydrolase [Micromonospora sp. WMMD882]
MRARRGLVAAATAVAALLLLPGAAPVLAEPQGHGPSRPGPSFTHGRVAVDGGALHYVRTGSGPPLVLLHGWPETWWSWRHVMPELAREHTVIAFDLPGLGDSTVPSDGYDKATTARRIRQAVHALGFRQIELMGHDVGALVAYPYARDFPDEVTRVAVVESPLLGFGLEDFYGRSWHFLFNSSPAPIPEKIMDNEDVPTYLGMMFDRTYKPEALDRKRYFAAYANPAKRTAGYEYYRAFAADAAENQAKAAANRLTMPVLAVGGQYQFGPLVGTSFAQVADDVRTAIVPEAGHYPAEENPQFTAACANLFFGATPPGQPTPPDLAACAP